MTSPSTTSFNTLRSLLFVPALNEKFIAGAHTRGAQAVVLDLEDSIIYERKPQAREALASAVTTIRPHGLPLLVRINNLPELIEADLRAAVLAGADAILIPKVDTAGMLRDADKLIAAFEKEAGRSAGSVRYIALIETPKGIFNLPEILSASKRLCGLGFGSEDFAAALGVEPDSEALSVPAQNVALAARAFDLAAWGLPGSIGNFNDTQAFLTLVRKAKAFGFTGTLGIHPKQITLINTAFNPGPEERAEAQRIIDAYEAAQRSGAGAVALDGKMIDAPIVERARRTLSL